MGKYILVLLVIMTSTVCGAKDDDSMMSSILQMSSDKQRNCLKLQDDYFAADSGSKAAARQKFQSSDCTSNLTSTCSSLSTDLNKTQGSLGKSCGGLAMSGLTQGGTCDSVIQGCLSSQSSVNLTSLTAVLALQQGKNQNCMLPNLKSNLEKERDRIQGLYDKDDQSSRDLTTSLGDKQKDDISKLGDMQKDISQATADISNAQIQGSQTTQDKIDEVNGQLQELQASYDAAKTAIMRVQSSVTKAKTDYQSAVRAIYQDCQGQGNQAIAAFNQQMKDLNQAGKLQTADRNQQLYYANLGKTGVNNLVYQQTYNQCLKDGANNKIKDAKDALNAAINEANAQLDEKTAEVARLTKAIEDKKASGDQNLAIISQTTATKLQDASNRLTSLNNQYQSYQQASQQQMQQLYQQSTVIGTRAQQESQQLTLTQTQLANINQKFPGINDQTASALQDAMGDYIQRGYDQGTLANTCCNGKDPALGANVPTTSCTNNTMKSLISGGQAN